MTEKPFAKPMRIRRKLPVKESARGRWYENQSTFEISRDTTPVATEETFE